MPKKSIRKTSATKKSAPALKKAVVLPTPKHTRTTKKIAKTNTPRIFYTLTLVILLLTTFLLGFTSAVYIAKDIQPRSLLSLKHCENACLEPSEAIGLVAAIGVTYAPNWIPNVVYETNQTIAIAVPFAQNYHVVVIPKKDIKNAGTISDEDSAYLTDAYAVMQKLIADNHLSKYVIYTNGPGYQKVAYLHFHLEAE